VYQGKEDGAVKGMFGAPEKTWFIAAVIAGGLLLGAIFVPLWRMELVAPQYPKGLVMYAYGDRFTDSSKSPYDDVREINELNHYIGMKPIKAVTEMSLFIPGVLAVAAGAFLTAFISWKRRLWKALIIAAFWTLPLFFLADIQWWLYHYGHTMDSHAALNTGSFTPKVVGSTKVWNFHSETRLQTGFYLMLAAALVITFVPPAVAMFARWRARARHAPAGAGAKARTTRGHGAAAIVLFTVALAASTLWPAHRAAAQDAEAGSSLTIQQRIDRAAPEDIVVVDGGVFRESIVINKPISLVGRNSPVIDGGGQGDVVTISADDVVITGFEIRGSSKTLSREPAAIKVKDAKRVTINSNHLLDAHFGIHITNSADDTIKNNVIDAGADTPIERRGHGIYLWEVSGSVLHANTIMHAADGIHLEFAEGNGIGGNTVTESRYALHTMYGNDTKIIANSFHDNLAGAVIMYSKDLILKDNEFSNNRRGATGSGMLIKDSNDIWVEGNRIIRNKYGMTVDGTPQSAGSTAIFRANLFALNDTGIGLLSNAPITFVENAMIDNVVQIEALSGDLATSISSHGDTKPTKGSATSADASLPKGAVWSSAGRGNYWSDYRGFDGDGDGVGDQPYEPRPPFAGRLANKETLRLFQYTPAQQAIDAAADMFPIYRYRAVIVDDGPLMEPPPHLGVNQEGGVNVRLLAISAVLLALSLAAVARLASIDVYGTLRRILRVRGRGSHPDGAPA
jgi:nitrous oxidase accessory protein